MKQIIKKILSSLFTYDYKKYWNRREKLYTEKIKGIRRKWYIFYIWSCNRQMNADIPIPQKNNFKSRPIDNNHGLNGIVIAAGAKIGKDCYISHQVTIGRSMNGVPQIGDNVYIGPGAKFFGDIKIGNNVRIGANCPVFFDVPDDTTVVLPKPRMILKEHGYEYYAYDKTKIEGGDNQ